MARNNQKFTRRGYKTGQHSLSEEEIQQFLNVVDELDLKIGFKIAIATGIRREDFARLKWNDVRWEENAIRFYESKKNSTHQVYLPDSLMNDLRILKNSTQNNIYLFDGRTDEKYGQGHRSGRSWYSKFQKYLKKAGLRERPFHALRATCIKQCERKGWPESRTANHVNDTVRTIQQHYSVPTESEMRHTVQDKPLL